MLIEDIEFVIFRHPEPEAARQFMLDYGLLDLEQKRDAVYLRSYGDAPFSYVTTKGKRLSSAWGSASPISTRSKHLPPGSNQRLMIALTLAAA